MVNRRLLLLPPSTHCVVPVIVMLMLKHSGNHTVVEKWFCMSGFPHFHRHLGLTWVWPKRLSVWQAVDRFVQNPRFAIRRSNIVILKASTYIAQRRKASRTKRNNGGKLDFTVTTNQDSVCRRCRQKHERQSICLRPLIS